MSDMSDMRIKTRNKKILTAAAAAGLILVPVFMMCLRSLQTGMNCFKVHSIWSDEMVYWREVYNFIHTGTSGGYTGADDMAPRLANFGTHSFMNTLVYAAFAFLFGWHDNSIMIYNLLFFVICLAVFVWQLKPKTVKMILLAVCIVFYLPIYYYLPTSMTEILNYGGILLYTAALLRYYKERREGWFFAALAATAFLTFYKLPNAVFFIPLVLAVFDKKITKKSWLHGIGCVAACGIIYVVNTAFTSPYPWFFSEVFEQESIGAMAAKIWGRFTDNLANFFSLHYGTRTEQMQRLFYAGMMLILFAAVICGIRKMRRQKAWEKETRQAGEGRLQNTAEHVIGTDNFQLAVSYLLMLLASFILIHAFYEVWDWRDYRMMAPVTWSALILMALRFPGKYMVVPVFAIVLMFGGEMITPNEVFISWERTVPIETPEISEWIAFDEQAEDRFDNTIAIEYVDLGIYCRLMPGIGVQNIFTPEAITRSKYILVQDTDYDFPGYHLEHEGDFGRLYVRD